MTRPLPLAILLLLHATCYMLHATPLCHAVYEGLCLLFQCFWITEDK